MKCINSDSSAVLVQLQFRVAWIRSANFANQDQKGALIGGMLNWLDILAVNIIALVTQKNNFWEL